MDGSSEDSELSLILREQKMRRRHLTELPLYNKESIGFSSRTIDLFFLT
jgi:hypothetical protein